MRFAVLEYVHPRGEREWEGICVQDVTSESQLSHSGVCIGVRHVNQSRAGNSRQTEEQR